MTRPEMARLLFAATLLYPVFLSESSAEQSLLVPREMDAAFEVPILGPAAEPAPVVTENELIGRKSNAYPKGDYYLHLTSPSGGGSQCRPDDCDWGWGCGGSPYRTGPGRCDDWRVGPIWRVYLDGVVMLRPDTNVDALVAQSNQLAGAVGTIPEVTDNFDYAPGVRLLASSQWPSMRGYELQMGYFGVHSWEASAVFPQVPPGLPLGGVTERRWLSYTSTLNSLEINFQASNDIPWKPFAGIRYLRLDEEIRDRIDQFAPPPDMPGDVITTTDLLDMVTVDNNLIGFQGGLRRDMWWFGERIYLEGFASGGVYYNMIKRTSLVRQEVNIRELDDPATEDIDEFQDTDSVTQSTVRTDRSEIAVVGEAALALVCKLNRCTALRGGYQVLYLNGVELADEAYLGLEPDRHDLLYHGWFAGLEYRR